MIVSRRKEEEEGEGLAGATRGECNEADGIAGDGGGGETQTTATC